jgi:hypothetical protein
LLGKEKDEALLKERVKALFDIYFDRENKKDQAEFLDLAEEVYIALLKDPWIENPGMSFFNILRTVKFVKGLEDEH